MNDDGWSWSRESAFASMNVPTYGHDAASTTRLPSLSSVISAYGVYDDENAVVVPGKPGTGKAAAAKPRLGGAATKSRSAAAPLSETSANVAASTSSRKRKSDTVEAAQPDPASLPQIDEDDPRLTLITDTCNQVRRKITDFIASGIMKVGEFQKALGVSSGAYQRFMKYTGTWDGRYCDTYAVAFAFFKRRELQGLPIKASKASQPASKKAKKGDEASLSVFDVSGVELEGEATGDVAVYDTCDEIRKKIRAFLRKPDVPSQAAFCRELAKGLHDGRKVNASSLSQFLGRHGPTAGNTSVVYYAAYVFFEKLRIKHNKPKSQMRLEMEDIWGEPNEMNHYRKGVDTTNNSNRGYWCLTSEQPYLDRYGRVTFMKR